MPYEITNSLKTSSVLLATGVGTYTITLAQLTANASLENVTSASIRRVNWTTNGSINITRNAVPLLDLYNTGEINFPEFGYSLANNATSSIVVTIVTGGSVVLELTKVSTYTANTGL